MVISYSSFFALLTNLFNVLFVLMATRGAKHMGTGFKGLLYLTLNTFFMLFCCKICMIFYFCYSLAVQLTSLSNPFSPMTTITGHSRYHENLILKWFFIHVHLLFNSSHFLHPLYLNHFIYFVALLHICHTESVFSFELSQHSDAGTWFPLCLTVQSHVALHPTKPIFVHDYEHVLHLQRADLSAMNVPRCWSDHITHLTYPGVTTSLFPACTFFTFLQWYICQQTIVCCWMLLENSSWGFSFFFICNFSIKLVTDVAFLSIIIPDSIFNHSLSSAEHQFWICVILSLEFSYCSSLRNPTGRWRAFQTEGFKNKRRRLAVPTGWLQTLNLAPLPTQDYTNSAELRGKCWQPGTRMGQGRD